jgi:hypothetical protein
MTYEDARTVERMRAGAAALRLQGQAAKAARIDDLADELERRGAGSASDDAAEPRPPHITKPAAVRARASGDKPGGGDGLALSLMGMLVVAGVIAGRRR